MHTLMSSALDSARLSLQFCIVTGVPTERLSPLYYMGATEQQIKNDEIFFHEEACSCRAKAGAILSELENEIGNIFSTGSERAIKIAHALLEASAIYENYENLLHEMGEAK